MFIVFRCRRCGRYLYARAGMKSRICPTCGFRNDLRRVLVVARVEDDRKAREIIRRFQGTGTGFRSLDETSQP